MMAAVQAGHFHVWAVHTIDEGIELLTGHPAGERDPQGQYPEGSVHHLVEERLRGPAQWRVNPDVPRANVAVLVTSNRPVVVGRVMEFQHGWGITAASGVQNGPAG
jgi:hypothetical protein